MGGPDQSTVTPTATAVPCRTLNWWLALILVWTLSGLYTASLLKRGWVPHDEGTFAQSAERVLAGQLPHRDFDDVYTGALSYLNAFAFRVFGHHLASPRIVLFLFFLAWVPAVYSIASRWASPLGASATTLLAVACGLPNYTAAAPSWYNLFFATFGTLAVLHYLETTATGWLFVAGLCGGLSFLFKLSGLYFIAGVLLLLVFREQETSRLAHGRANPHLYRIFLHASLILFVGMLFAMVRGKFSTVALVEFALPGTALAALCLRGEWQAASSPSRDRFAAFLGMLVPFAIGALLPVLIFLIPYIRSGAWADFFHGVFLVPTKRLDFAGRRPAGFGLNKILATGALVGVLVAACRSRTRFSWILGLPVVSVLAAIFVLSKNHPGAFVLAWSPLPLLVPLGVLAGTLLLGNAALAAAIPPLRRQQVMLLLSVMALCSLIQLPFSVGIYFCYIAPLLVLALLTLYSTQKHTSGFLLGSLLIFYLAFFVLRVTPGFLYIMGNYYQPNPQTQRLNLERAGGLRVAPEEAKQYEQLIPVVQEHSGVSEFIYAAPDCPQVYFLAGKQNPTPTLFDFFDQSAGRTQRILDAIESHQVKAVAILTRPAFSPPMAPDLLQALRERYPDSEKIGQFEVRWRP